MLPPRTIGEIERLADICHEYEVPYRLGEFEDSPTGSRLAADSTAGGVPALVLLKAPLEEGVAIPGAKLTIFGNADLFETLTAAPRSRSRPKTASFFTDISDLRPGDHVVHVDHGIGRFDGLRQIAVDGTNGEFMLLSLCGRGENLSPARSPRPGPEISIPRRSTSGSRPSRQHHLGGSQSSGSQIC